MKTPHCRRAICATIQAFFQLGSGSVDPAAPWLAPPRGNNAYNEAVLCHMADVVLRYGILHLLLEGISGIICNGTGGAW